MVLWGGGIFKTPDGSPFGHCEHDLKGSSETQFSPFTLSLPSQRVNGFAWFCALARMSSCQQLIMGWTFKNYDFGWAKCDFLQKLFISGLWYNRGKVPYTAGFLLPGMKSQKRTHLKFLLSIHCSLSFFWAFIGSFWWCDLYLTNSIHVYIHKIVHPQRGLPYLSVILLAVCSAQAWDWCEMEGIFFLNFPRHLMVCDLQA